MKFLNKIYSKSFLLYLAIGMLAFVIEYLSFLAFSINGMVAGGALLFAQTASFCLGFLTSFFGNRYITFGERKTRYRMSAKSQLWSYGLLAVANLLLSNVAIVVLVGVFILPPAFAKLLVMGMVFVWNYTIFSRFIFREKIV